ncbi:hypothetical protein VTN02DRAFT_6726 [Thermoascus thermophilus]
MNQPQVARVSMISIPAGVGSNRYELTNHGGAFYRSSWWASNGKLTAVYSQERCSRAFDPAFEALLAGLYYPTGCLYCHDSSHLAGSGVLALHPFNALTVRLGCIFILRLLASSFIMPRPSFLLFCDILF